MCAVGALGGEVAVGDQAVLEIEELALDFAISGGRLLVGPQEDHAVAAVDDHQVAAFDLAHDPLDPRDGRDAAAARQDRGMAGRPAELGDDPRDRQVPQAHGLAGQNLVRHQDDRFVAVACIAVARLAGRIDVPDLLPRQVRLDPQDHVADIGHALAKELLLAPRQLGGVTVHDHLKRRQGRQLLIFDQSMNLGKERRVVDDLQVALEDVGLGGTQHLGDLLDDDLQVSRRSRHGPVEALDFRRNQARVVESLLLDRAQHRLHAMGNADHDSRTDTNSLTHDEPVSRFRGDRTEHALHGRRHRTGLNLA